MPGKGSTRRMCVVCHTELNVACKTCNACKVKQPQRLRLQKKLQKFDQKREGWVHIQKKNRTTSHIKDEAVLLLEKLQALGLRAVLLWSKPGKKPNDWVSEVLAPRCQLTERSNTCLGRIKELYNLVIQGWTPQDAEAQAPEPSSAPGEPPTGPPMVTADPQTAVALIHPPAAPTGPLAALIGPPKSPIGQPVSLEPSTEPPMVTTDPQTAVALIHPPAAPTAPPAALIGPPKSPIGQPVSLLATPQQQSQNLGKGPHSAQGPLAASPVSLEKDEGVEGGFPAPTTVRPHKKKECPHTVKGSQDFYPVKRVAKCKVIKGQKWKQVEWEPCKLCGKKWPLEWVADMDTC